MHLTSCFHLKLGLLIYTKGWFEGSLLTKLNIVEWFAGKLPNFRQGTTWLTGYQKVWKEKEKLLEAPSSSYNPFLNTVTLQPQWSESAVLTLNYYSD